MIYKAKGRNGSVELYQDRVVIKKKFSGLTALLKGGKEIPIKNIKNIKYKTATALTWGFIQFATRQNSRKLSKGSLLASPMDDYSVNFSRKQQPQFDRLKSEIKDVQSGGKQQKINQYSEADEIKKLANLKEQGIITQEEFEKKKKQILGI